MAVKGNEVELLGDGIQANAPSKGSFALNMLYDSNAWHVRDGFGQVTQFDTTMCVPVLPGPSPTFEWGYIKHLGSRLIKTNFGNLQMVSVFWAKVLTSDVEAASEGLPVYQVSIYDLDTNERFEVPLYPHTSQSAVSHSYDDTVPTTTPGARSPTQLGFGGNTGSGLQLATPQYQTSASASYASWVSAPDEFFFFEEFNDILFFGNTAAGVWAYMPASFNQSRPTMLDRVNRHEYAAAYGESSMVTPVVLSPGINPEAFDYLRTSDMPSAVDVAVVQNRMVYASGKTLFWSDPGFPGAITAENFFAVPSEEDITAIAELNSNLVIFTENETWLYQPSVGDIVSAGRLTRTSDTAGCVGANALAKVEGALVWVDSGGVYSTTNGLSVQSLSSDIKPFFSSEGMGNPLTSFFVGNDGSIVLDGGGYVMPDGLTSIAYEQSATTLRFSPDGVSCAYSAERGLLLISIPALSGALALTRGKWAWWTFESMVKLDPLNTPVIGVTQNLPSPWVMSYQSDLFAIAGPDIQSIADSTEATGTDPDDGSIFRSFFIMEYGRGGAIDRSVSFEDDRRLGGVWHNYSAALVGAPDGGLYFHDPIPVPNGYVFGGQVPGETASGDRYVLIPVTLALPEDRWDASADEGIDLIELKCSFDNTHWAPVFIGGGGGGAHVELMVPPERLGSAECYRDTNGELAVFSDDTFTSMSTTGAYLWLYFDGNAAVPTYTHKPYMNLNQGRHNLLMFLPFKRLNDPASKMDNALSEMGFRAEAGYPRIQDSTNSEPVAPLVINWKIFRRWSQGEDYVRSEDSVSQPVDWAYKATNVGMDGDQELKMRGTWVNLLSHGAGVEKLSPPWPYGLFNTLAGSNRKEWMTQIVDLTPEQPAVEGAGVDATGNIIDFGTSKSTLRTRIQSTSGELVDKSFGDSIASISRSPIWDGSTVSHEGNLLIGDEDTNVISVSMSVKGRTFSLMHFGFIMNRAERLVIEGIKTVFRVVGGRRRRGG